MLVQEAFEANSVAAEKRYMRHRHEEAAKATPGRHMRTLAPTDMQAEQLCSVVFDLTVQQRVHVLPKPVYAVSPDGTKATSFDFDRLDAIEPGGPVCLAYRLFFASLRPLILRHMRHPNC